MNQQNYPKGHLFGNDAVCADCGFDGAEWSHWRNYTYEGRARTDVKKPLCTKGDRAEDEYLHVYEETWDDFYDEYSLYPGIEDDYQSDLDNWGDE